MLTRTTRITLLCFVTLMWSTQPSYAYLDPGTGSIILQGFLAAVASGIVVVKVYWSKLSGFFSKKPSSDRKSDS